MSESEEKSQGGTVRCLRTLGYVERYISEGVFLFYQEIMLLPGKIKTLRGMRNRTIMREEENLQMVYRKGKGENNESIAAGWKNCGKKI